MTDITFKKTGGVIKPVKVQSTKSDDSASPKKPVAAKKPTKSQPTPPIKQGQKPAPMARPQYPAQGRSAWDQWDDWGNDPYGDNGGFSGGYGMGGGFGGGYGGGFGGRQPQTPQKRMTPEERIQMIEKVYDEVLCRKPDTRDINYYKYSTLGEEQIRNQLIASSEHKDLLKKGQEHKKLKEEVDQLQTKNRMLENQVKDQFQEFKELNLLLQEKNNFIQRIRNGQEKIYISEETKSNNVPQCVLTQPAQDTTLQPTTSVQINTKPSQIDKTMRPQTFKMPDDVKVTKKKATAEVKPELPPISTTVSPVQESAPAARFTDELNKKATVTTNSPLSNIKDKIQDIIGKFS